MRALLDTNIIIHRENKRVSNYSIGHLFRWLDKLKYDKVIHPYSISEIKKYRDPETQEAISVKLESYEVIKTIKEPDDSFLELIGIPEKSQNDMIDDCLLFEVYSNRVDILITEDRRLRNKAIKLGLSDRVFSINAFISAATAENPSLIEYKMLAVEKTYFGNVDLTDSFFDSFRIAYPGFDKWFARKCDEEAYICNTDAGKVLGFLYLKTEGVDENYSDIVPPFKPMRRLKVGTFKVESTGFRLGERFVKIIFDNALQRNVDEIYVTLYTDREELSALAALLKRWGFTEYGVKIGNGKEEQVLVKRMKDFDHNISFRKNFPNIQYDCNKYILPIFPQYPMEVACLLTVMKYYGGQQDARTLAEWCKVDMGMKQAAIRAGMEAEICLQNMEQLSTRKFPAILFAINDFEVPGYTISTMPSWNARQTEKPGRH